jgi:tRNA nucleotidyltransferase (CCA-adding enzyme)
MPAKPVGIEKVLKNALPKVKPSPADEKAMQAFATKVKQAAAKACGKSARPQMVGSVEKGTWLSGKRELDLFLLFPATASRDDLQKKGLAFAEATIKAMKGKWQVAYAEHPYLKGSVKFQGLDYAIDVVPAFDIPDPAKIKSAVDRTPHHVIYVKSKLNAQLADQVRLIKAFAKAAGAYGADVKTQGFSGYLCELLTIRYGGFAPCLSAAKDWYAGLLIDMEGKWKDHAAAMDKFKAPLMLIDPVDSNRNVAAAVSAESFYKFVKASRDFLKLPHARWFSPIRYKPYGEKELAAAVARRGTRWYIVRFDRPADLVDDILWPQMRRAVGALESSLAEGGFRVMRKDCWADDKLGVLLLELDVWQVPRAVKHIGPVVWSHQQAKSFLEHYKGKRVWIEKDNWVTETERSHVVALHYLREILSKPDDVLQSKGIPNHLSAPMGKAAIVSGGNAIALAAKLPEDFRVFVRDFLEKDLNVLG